MANMGNEKKADKKIRLRKEAEERNAAHAGLTAQQKIDKLNAGAYRASKERAKLKNKIGK